MRCVDGVARARRPTAGTVTVEKAVFGLAAHPVDGRQALVPSWLFEVRAAGAQDALHGDASGGRPEVPDLATPSGDPPQPAAERAE